MGRMSVWHSHVLVVKCFKLENVQLQLGRKKNDGAYLFTGIYGMFCDRLQENLANMTEENHEQILLRSSYVRELWECRKRSGN